MHVINLTPSQLESYRLIWGSFTNFDWTFLGQERTFGFYGRLRVDEAGRVDLLDLCVACSGKHAKDEIKQLRQTLRSGSAVSRFGPGTADCRVELLSGETDREIMASHLILTYGDSVDLKQAHFNRFEPKTEEPEDPFTMRNEYYQASARACPEAARSVSVPELGSLVSQNPVIAFTGAGISTGSGIPSFRGPRGLERHFPLQEPFPGTVARFMIENPQELMRILGEFQAAFIQAEPNDAHRSLADLERKGTIRHIITGNGDKLHERAGSVNIHLKRPDYFKPSGRGWEWLKEGKVLLVVGLGRDEHGLISYSRDNGMMVASISPDRPEFLHQEDLYVNGKAEDVLPHLAS